MALIAAEPGTVNTQAQTTLPATPQRTADTLRTVPTPTIAPVMVWVVETGMPSAVAPNSVAAPAVSAQQPPTGSSLVIFMPIVLTMRQPPLRVPRPIAAWQAITTQNGTCWLWPAAAAISS